jgi:ATP-dependent DNA ligase
MHIDAAQARKLQKDQDAYVQFKVWDIVRYGDKDLRQETLRTRRAYLALFFDHLNMTEWGKYFDMEVLYYTGKRTFFDATVAAGGEGAVLKNLNSVYNDSTGRDRNSWVKVKKRRDYDAFVTGFERGEPGAWHNLVGTLHFSVFTEHGLHEIGVASNMDLAFRQAITEYDPATDTVSLRKDMYHKVAQISGQDIAPRVYRLTHCTIDRWRDQGGDAKNAQECVESYADLTALALWIK